MENVQPLLDSASRRLFRRIASIMETQQNTDHALALRQAAETVEFPIDWSAFLEEIQRALYDTALSRYTTCYNGENIPKRKEPSSPEVVDPSDRRPAPPQPSNPGGSPKKSGRRNRRRRRKEANTLPNDQVPQASSSLSAV